MGAVSEAFADDGSNEALASQVAAVSRSEAFRDRSHPNHGRARAFAKELGEKMVANQIAANNPPLSAEAAPAARALADGLREMLKGPGFQAPRGSTERLAAVRDYKAGMKRLIDMGYSGTNDRRLY